MDFETEEQQIEALKRWWKENGRMVIAGLILGVAVIAGWRFYVDYKKQHEEMASAIYENVMLAVSANSELAEQELRVNNLMAEYADTPYASLAALVLAKQQLQNNDALKAQQQLDWVIKHTKQPELQHIARLRLVRILLASKQYDQANALLNIDYPESFAALYEELKGDVYLANGDKDNARIAYDKAILSSGGQASQLLKLKRDDLGVADMSEPSS